MAPSLWFFLNPSNRRGCPESGKPLWAEAPPSGSSRERVASGHQPETHPEVSILLSFLPSSTFTRGQFAVTTRHCQDDLEFQVMYQQLTPSGALLAGGDCLVLFQVRSAVLRQGVSEQEMRRPFLPPSFSPGPYAACTPGFTGRTVARKVRIGESKSKGGGSRKRERKSLYRISGTGLTCQFWSRGSGSVLRRHF